MIHPRIAALCHALIEDDEGLTREAGGPKEQGEDG